MPSTEASSLLRTPSLSVQAGKLASGSPLPVIDSSRRAPGHTEEGSALSAFLGLATTMTGACILALPGVVQAVGVVPTLLLFSLGSWLAFQSCEMLTVCCDATTAFSFEALSSRLFGAMGVWAVRLLTLALLFGAIVSYFVIAMDLLEPFVAGSLSRTGVGVVFLLVALPLCLPETIHALRYANLLVLLCVLCILCALMVRTVENDRVFAAHIERNQADEFTSELAALAYATPIVTMGFICQLNVPRAYQELHTKAQMTRVHQALMAWGLAIYLLFAMLGFACFHGQPPSDVLTGFRADDTLMNGARLALGVAMVLKTPMTFQPLRQLVELCCLGHDRESLPFRTAITAAFLLLAHLLSVYMANLGAILALVGSVAGHLLVLAVPALLLRQVQRSYVVDATDGAAAFSPTFALGFACTGVVLAVASLSYLSYNALM